ncbi:MAG: hypothetical protein F2667_07535 [Actinobacteria bacterium]|uniref:Unannotated protein n=1 Tax=freshwater metagenome TaxID=449393 RepID=A0A6J6QGN0_9ZZZZ|nr:hypothetical protein [Actinomycetota bacterium]
MPGQQCVHRRDVRHDDVASIVAAAVRAPSVHNTQPWRWRTTATGVALYADHERRLALADPQGRGMLISCGAALEHALVAARALGIEPLVHRSADPMDGGPVATIDLTWHLDAPDLDRARADLAVLLRRRTDHRRFTTWPVPPVLLQDLASVAARDGVQALPVLDPAARLRTELLVHQAQDVQGRDAGLVSEVRRCSADAEIGRTDGLVLSDALVVLATAFDAPRDWVVIGEALTALWLASTAAEISVVPLCQVVEVDQTRDVLRWDVLGGRLHPQLVVRLGWQELSRSTLPPTSRRSVAEVLDNGPDPSVTRDPRPGAEGPPAVGLHAVGGMLHDS